MKKVTKRFSLGGKRHSVLADEDMEWIAKNKDDVVLLYGRQCSGGICWHTRMAVASITIQSLFVNIPWGDSMRRLW